MEVNDIRDLILQMLINEHADQINKINASEESTHIVVKMIDGAIFSIDCQEISR